MNTEHMNNFMGFHHIELWVGNAKQAASYYTTRFGFVPLAYKGLETGSRDVASHVVQQGNIVLVFSSPVGPGNIEICNYQSLHGDAVKKLAVCVRSCEQAYERAMKAGATSVSSPLEESDTSGRVRQASIQAVGDTILTFIERTDYRGSFLPGFEASNGTDDLTSRLPPVGASKIDHLGFNLFDGELLSWVTWFERTLDFHRFFSIDDTIVHSEFSGLRSIIMSDSDETIKVPLIEPARGTRKSQIEEFLEYNGGVGAQHLALQTPDILATASALQARGAPFLSVPPDYYELLQTRISSSPADRMGLASLQKFNIMVDQDEKGYLLQVFTMPISDRPTFFLEFLQRCNHKGFGANNFKSIFEAIEIEQQRRGNLKEA